MRVKTVFRVVVASRFRVVRKTPTATPLQVKNASRVCATHHRHLPVRKTVIVKQVRPVKTVSVGPSHLHHVQKTATVPRVSPVRMDFVHRNLLPVQRIAIARQVKLVRVVPVLLLDPKPVNPVHSARQAKLVCRACVQRPVPKILSAPMVRCAGKASALSPVRIVRKTPIVCRGNLVSAPTAAQS